MKGGGDTLNLENNILPSSFFDDTLSPSEIAEKIEKMRQNKFLVEKYRDKIKTRKDGRQIYVLINRKQISATTIEALYDKLWEIEFGRRNSTLASLYPEWLLWKRDNTAVCAKTLKEYNFIWEKIMKGHSLTEIPLKKLTIKDFIAFFRELTKTREITKKKFTNIKSLLNGIYAYAIEEDIVNHNPIRDIDCKQFSFKPVNHSNEAFSINERELLINHLKENDNIYSLAIQLDFCLVLRIGELLALKWSDIEGNNIHIQSQLLTDAELKNDLTFTQRSYVNVDHVKGNTDKGFRYQPLTEKTIDILNRIKKVNPDGEFILMQNGKQLLSDTFNEYLKKYCIEVGIKPRSSHKIRFTNASILYDSGMPLANLQSLLGHTTSAMTLHYIRPVTPTETTKQIMMSALG